MDTNEEQINEETRIVDYEKPQQTEQPEQPQQAEQPQADPYAPSCYAEKYYAYDRRFGEYIIDYISICALSFIAGLVIAILDGGTTSDLISDVIGCVVVFLYYFIMESTTGKTLGKMACGLKLVDADGNQPAADKIALRTLCRLVPFEAFSFLFGKGWTKEGFGGYWHDNWSKTYVVDEREIKADQKKNA